MTNRSRWLQTLTLLTFVLLAAWVPPSHAASWTPVTATASDFAGTMLLLTDGRVMIQGHQGGANWMLLTPSSTGSYIGGTWSATALMSTPRLYFASHLLRDGRVWVLGGEYSGSPLSQNWTNTGEIYNPLTDSWAAISHHPDSQFGDDPTMLLNGDKILAGSLTTKNTFIYDIASNTWGPAISKVYADQSDEETWVKLGNGKVVTYDLFESIGTGGAYAEVFDPVAGTWASLSPSDGSALGTIPQLSSAAVGEEMGPAFRLQDGRIFQVGATEHTALYDPVTNTWSAGPDIPLQGGVAYGATDAPGAILPNGKVIFTASPKSPLFSTPTKVFIFDPAANTIVLEPTAQPAGLISQLAAISSYLTRMLVLPTGQVLLADDFNTLWVYTPDGPVNPAMRPVVNAVVNHGGGSFTATGKQLNGQSAGSSYGDDAEMDENYPMIRLTSTTSGKVYYTRATNWSTTGVGPGPESVDFNTPAAMPSGRYSLVAVGAGIPSFPIFINVP